MNTGLIVNDILQRIDKVTDESDRFVSRILVKFNNGYSLSVIRGPMSYGGRQGLFEIAIFDILGEFCTKCINYIRFGEDINDDVIGWLDESEVKQWALFVSALPMGVRQ